MPLVGVDAPVPVGAVQRARIAIDEHAAERREARRIGARHHQRIGERGDVRPHQRMAEHRQKARLKRERAFGIERLRRDADLRAELELRLHRLERRIAAIERDPAGLAQVFHRAQLFEQLLVLGDRGGHQRAQLDRAVLQLLRRRPAVICDQPRRDLQEIAPMVVRLGRALERDLDELLQAARERGRKHARADDDAGVAVARLLAGPAPVDQRDRQPALDQMQRDRRADNAGSQNDCIGTRHEDPRGGSVVRENLHIASARLSTPPSMADMPHTSLPDAAFRRRNAEFLMPFRRAGRSACLARPAGHARGRGLVVHRRHGAAARGAAEADLRVRAVRTPLPCVPARRSGRSRQTFLPAEAGRGRRHLDDARHAAADRASRWSRSGVADRLPGLYIAMILQAAAPPVISAPSARRPAGPVASGTGG